MEEYGPLAKRKNDKRNCHEEVAVPDGNGPEHQEGRRRADGTVASELSERVQSLRDKGEPMNRASRTGLATWQLIGVSILRTRSIATTEKNMIHLPKK